MHSKLQIIEDPLPALQSAASSSPTMPSKQWLKEGLRFQCTECGKCCTGGPGYVWVSEKEISEIADFLQIPTSSFKQKYIRQKNNRLALIEKPSQNYDCVFLAGKRCSIYSVRPSQCRTFPWWPAHLKSQESWQEAAKICEGIREEAPVVPYTEIKKQLDMACNSGVANS